MAAIADNVHAVRDTIASACARAGRAEHTVRLIAVTKAQTPAVLPALAAAGITDIGENRIDHQRDMHAALPTGLRMHAIGRVQSKQFGKLLPLTDCLHSLHDPTHVAKLNRACAGLDRTLPVYVQVNTSGEDAKAGVTPADLPALLETIAEEGDRLEVQGLMTMAPFTDDEPTIRRAFAALRELADRHGLARLSMGMSNDYHWAIQEGATDVRVGTALFQ